MEQKKILSLEGIDVYYGEVQALFDVSIDVFDGEIVSIIGSNGAGKTTTMRSIMGLRSPKKGKITFDGQEIHKLPTHKIVDKGIVYVPEGRLVFPDLSVEVNLEMGAYSRNYSKAEMQQMMEEQFELFPRLKERRNQLAGSLSGGEQQMLAIARGIMARPKLMMFDEPSLGLAPVIVSQMFEVIKELNQEGISILLIEQNANKALQISDHAYILQTGLVVRYGTGEELLEYDTRSAAYLGE
jgi:branched-chain amino acid transport system ATP-binding protein